MGSSPSTSWLSEPPQEPTRSCCKVRARLVWPRGGSAALMGQTATSSLSPGPGDASSSALVAAERAGDTRNKPEIFWQIFSSIFWDIFSSSLADFLGGRNLEMSIRLFQKKKKK